MNATSMSLQIHFLSIGFYIYCVRCYVADVLLAMTDSSVGCWLSGEELLPWRIFNQPKCYSYWIVDNCYNTIIVWIETGSDSSSFQYTNMNHVEIWLVSTKNHFLPVPGGIFEYNAYIRHLFFSIFYLSLRNPKYAIVWIFGGLLFDFVRSGMENDPIGWSQFSVKKKIAPLLIIVMNEIDSVWN